MKTKMEEFDERMEELKEGGSVRFVGVYCLSVVIVVSLIAVLGYCF